VLLAIPARAQDVAAAEALFRAGRELLLKGDYAAACPKLAESNRIDPSSGTALNVALCHLKQGKTATAWAEYIAAARLARQQQKPDRLEEATKKAAELEGGLSHLTIVVSRPVAGLDVLRDDVSVAASTFGTNLPVDPGRHVIVATAPGYKRVTIETTVAAEHDAQVVTIPPLEPEGPADAPPAASSGPSAAPWIVGGVGLAALAIGGGFGVAALVQYHDAKSACPTRMGCSSGAVAESTRAYTFANVANGGIAVGGVGVAIAAILFATRPKRPPPSQGSLGSTFAVEPMIAPRVVRLQTMVRF
jgi:hypothetical protein